MRKPLFRTGDLPPIVAVGCLTSHFYFMEEVEDLTGGTWNTRDCERIHRALRVPGIDAICVNGGTADSRVGSFQWALS